MMGSWLFAKGYFVEYHDRFRICDYAYLSIAVMRKVDFLRKWRSMYPGQNSLGEEIYRQAVARRAYVLLHRIRKVQDNEPHYRAARF